MSRIMPVFVCFFLFGCAVYSLVEPRPVTIGEKFVVSPEFKWSKITTGNSEVWTVDGVGLQSLNFTTGVADGEVLYSGIATSLKSPLPKFNKNMTPLEIKDFLMTSFTAVGALGVQTQDFRPVTIDDTTAYRAEFSYTMEDGLDRKGFSIGFVKDEKLNLITYAGAKLHYFSKHKDDVERMLAKIKIL